MSQEKINIATTKNQPPKLPSQVEGLVPDEDITTEPNNLNLIDLTDQAESVVPKVSPVPVHERRIAKQGLVLDRMVGSVAIVSALGVGYAWVDALSTSENQTAARQLSAEFADTAEKIIYSDEANVIQEKNFLDGVEGISWQVTTEAGKELDIAIDSDMTRVDVTTPVGEDGSVTSTYTISDRVEKDPNPELHEVISVLDERRGVLSVDIDKSANPNYTLETVKQSYESLSE